MASRSRHTAGRATALYLMVVTTMVHHSFLANLIGTSNLRCPHRTQEFLAKLLLTRVLVAKTGPIIHSWIRSNWKLSLTPLCPYSQPRLHQQVRSSLPPNCMLDPPAPHPRPRLGPARSMAFLQRTAIPQVVWMPAVCPKHESDQTLLCLNLQRTPPCPRIKPSVLTVADKAFLPHLPHHPFCCFMNEVKLPT